MRYNAPQLLTASLLALAAPAFGQVWVYQAWGSSGPTDAGTLTLEKSGDSYLIRKMAGRLSNVCDRNSLQATVEQPDDVIVVTTIPLVSDCAAERYKIKKDGTGGTREVKTGDNWIADGRDRKLTLKN